MAPIAIIPGKHEKLLTAFKEVVCSNPDANFAPSIATLSAEFRALERERERFVVHTLLLNLYAQDARSLSKDLAKIAVLGTAQATPSQRAALLRCLYGVVSLYVQNGFFDLIAMCDGVEDASSMGDSGSFLDTSG